MSAFFITKKPSPRFFLALGCSAWMASAYAVDATSTNLAGELDSLSASGDMSPPVRAEKYQVSQDRHFNLSQSVALTVGAGTTMNNNVYLTSRDVNLSLTYNINNRFYVKAAGSRVRNTLTKSGESLYEDEKLTPNFALVNQRADVTAGFNLLYGKARVTRDAMFYFDQYVGLGGGQVKQRNGDETVTSSAIVGDVGFAFWFGDRMNLNVGVKDYFYNEKRVVDESRIHEFVAYSSVGYLVGGSKI